MINYLDLSYDKRLCIKQIIELLQTSGFICAATAPKLYSQMREDDDLLTVVNQSLQPLMMKVIAGLNGHCYCYVPLTSDAEHMQKVLRHFNKEIRFVIEFRRLIGRLTHQVDLVPARPVEFAASLALIEKQEIVFELLKDCYNQLKRTSKTDSKTMLEAVLDVALKMSLLCKTNNDNVFLVTARLLYVQELIDHIFQQEQLKYDVSDDLAILQGELL